MLKQLKNGIIIKDLTKVFGNNTPALNSVTMNFDENKITGLIGFNGSGKTTTFNILTNFIETYSGDVSIDGMPVTDIETTRKISYLAAGSEPKNTMRVMRHLRTIADINGLSKEEAISEIERLSKAVELEDVLKWQIRRLSKGNQQKVKIISSLLNKSAKYYFLDEPFDGLDPVMVKKVMKLYLGLKDVSIIITSHRMDVVNDMVSSFYVLKEGVLIDSKTEQDKEIVIHVNPKVSTKEIRKMSGVISIKKLKEVTEITIEDISKFKAVNKKLISSPDYIYSSLKEKNLSDSVFEGYGV